MGVKKRLVIIYVACMVCCLLVCGLLVCGIPAFNRFAFYHQATTLKNTTVVTFCINAARAYKEINGDRPVTLADITNRLDYQMFMSYRSPKLHRAVAADSYCILASNIWEFGCLWDKGADNVEIEVTVGCNFGTNVFLPFKCRNARELVRMGFTGVVLSGRVQTFTVDGQEAL
jgi:hypothetical protein